MSEQSTAYWINKVNLWRTLAMSDMKSGNTQDGIHKLFQMSHAMSMVQQEQKKSKELS